MFRARQQVFCTLCVPTCTFQEWNKKDDQFLDKNAANFGMAAVGIEPTTLGLIALRSTAELCCWVVIYKIFLVIFLINHYFLYQHQNEREGSRSIYNDVLTHHDVILNGTPPVRILDRPHTRLRVREREGSRSNNVMDMYSAWGGQKESERSKKLAGSSWVRTNDLRVHSPTLYR
jgi:hypothetical protein